jgi:hypothetical protein
MRLGIRARELWDHKLGVAIALVLALLVAGRTFAGAGFPPGLSSGLPDTARAATQILVDTPHSTVVDLRQETYGLEELTNRGLLVSNAIANPPVQELIAARAGIAAESIAVTTPLDAESASGQQSSQIAGPAFPTKYRLNVHADVTVPVIDIDTEAPTKAGATKLANAAAEGLEDYLERVARAGATPVSERVRLVQLGRAQAVSVSEGAGIVIAALVFAIVFAFASATVLFVARVRRGWSPAAGLPTPS